MTLEDRWEQHDDDYIKFDRVKEKRSQRPDLHAFLLLDEIFPNPGNDMVSAAEHDEIYLDIPLEVIEQFTDEQILELTRCGVRFDSEYECLSMFA